MRLFFAVLILWAATASIERWGGGLPPVIVWVWWTSALMLCGASAWADIYLSLAQRVAGLIAYTMLAAYYITQQATYLTFIPTDPNYPDLWATIYLVVNLVAPIGLTTTGIIRMAIQIGEDG